MGYRRFALVLGAVLFAGLFTHAVADPGGGSGSGSGSDQGGDIEMEPDTVGSGSGSATPAPPPPTETPPDAAPVKDPKVAKKWAAAATQLVQKGDYLTNHNKAADAKAQYENAMTAYQKAIEAGDDSQVYPLAIVEDKLGFEAEAYHHLKTALAAQPAMKPDVAKKAQAKLDEITGKVGMVKLVITPEGTTVTISGKEYGEAPLKEPLVLPPGTYTASFSAAGYQPKDAEIKVEAGSESERKIDLDVIPITIKPHVYEPDVEPDVVQKPSMLPLYIGTGATGVFLLTATITGISAISQHHAFTDPTFSESERKDAQSTGRTMEHVTDICLVGMLGAAAFTAYWYQYKYKPALDAPPPSQTRIVPKVDVIPWVQPDGSGLVVAGSF